MKREKTRGNKVGGGEQPAQNFIHEYVRRRLKTTALWNLDTITNHEHERRETERAQCQYVTR